MSRPADTLGNILLSPFWLTGRLIRHLATLWQFIWVSFNDGLGGDKPDNNTRDTMSALVVVWLILLTALEVW